MKPPIALLARTDKVIEYGIGTVPMKGMDRQEGDMLSGIAVLGVGFGLLAFMWIAVLVGSPFFGSPPEH